MYKGDMFSDANFMKIGGPIGTAASGNPTNHLIEQR